MSDLHAFVRRLAEAVASHDPAALRSPLAIGEIQARMMPYRACRRALRLETAEEYELLLLRLAAEESGLARTYPPESAERARVEVGSVLPDLAFLQQLQDATILLNLGPLAAVPTPSVPASPTEDEAGVDSGGDGADSTPINGMEQDSPTLGGEADAGSGTGEPDPIDEPYGHTFDSGEFATAAPVQPVEAIVPAIDPTPAPPVPTVSRTEPTTDPGGTTPPLECPHCARTLPQGRPVRFCPSCGQNVLVRLCASCRSEMELEWRHCVVCGHQATDTHRFA